MINYIPNFMFCIFIELLLIIFLMIRSIEKDIDNIKKITGGER